MAARGRDLELALRIRADLDQAVTELRAVESGLDAISSTGKRAAAALGKVDTSALKGAGEAAKEAAVGIERTGEAADAAATRIQRMVAASLEQKQALNAQVAAELAAADAARQNTQITAERAAEIERVNQAAFESRDAASAQMEAIGELNSRIERGARSLEDLAQIEAQIDQQMQAGLLTEQEQLEMFEALDKQEKQLIATQAREQKQVEALLRAYDPATSALQRLAREEAQLKAAVDAGRISREQYNRAMLGIAAQRAQWEQVSTGVDKASRSLGNLNLRAGQVGQSLATIARNLATGDISGAGSALLTLGSRGAIGFGALGLAIGGVTAALTLFAVAAFKGRRESNEMERVLIATGTASGITGSRFVEMADRIDRSTGAIGKGRQALLALINTGAASAETAEGLARSAVQLSELTGKSVEDTTAQIQRLLKEPSKVAAELDKQYHFLTLSIFQQIEALERQGDVMGAQKIAAEALGKALTERLDDVREHLGLLERGWDGVARGAKIAWDAMLNIGREDTVAQQLKELSREMARVDAVRRSQLAAGDLVGAEAQRRELLRLQEEFKRKNIELAKQEEAAAAQATADQAKANAIEAVARQDAALAQDRQIAKARALKQLEQDIAAIRAQAAKEGVAPTIGGIAIDEAEKQLRARIDERFKEPKTPKTDADRAEDAFQQKKLSLTQDLARAQQELTSAQRGQAASTDQQSAALEAWIATSEKAKKLTADQVTELRRLAKSIDETSAALQAEQDADKLAEAQVQVLRAMGQNAKAAEEELENRYDDLLLRLAARGDKAGEQIIRNLISAEKAKVALDDIAREFDRSTQDISREEQRINIARENGLISAAEAQRRLIGLRQRDIALLQETIPKLEAQNAAFESSSEIHQRNAARIEDLKLKLFELQNQSGLLATAFRNAFEGGLANALTNLATGTASLRDALTGLLQDMTRSLANFAAQQLASIATAKLVQLAGGKGGPNLQTPDPGQAAQAGAAYAAPIGVAAAGLSTSGGVVLSAAVALQAAAGAISAAAIQLQVANATSAAGAFDIGGYTGPGGKYQVAGVVHKGEFVQPQAALRQPGALHFMENFRRLGMRAIDTWRGYAGGGLVVDSPRLSSQSRGLTAPAASGADGERSRSAMLLGLEDGLVLKHLQSSGGVDTMIHNIARNPGRFRRVLGVG